MSKLFESDIWYPLSTPAAGNKTFLPDPEDSEQNLLFLKLRSGRVVPWTPWPYAEWHEYPTHWMERREGWYEI